MTGFVQDVRYAARALVRSPGFAAVAIATLALGIGATTIVYSLVDGILLRPLPIHEPERVVLAREVTSDGEEFSLAWPNFVDWKERSRSFAGLAAWSGLPTNLTGVEQPRRLMARQITWNLLDVLGVQPILGRGLTEADDRPGAERVCLVSYGFWQRELGGTDSAIGRQVILDERPYIVVGVLPADFTIARQEDIFRPLGGFLNPGSSLLGRGNHNGLAAIGRLAPGATVESARAELAAIAADLEKEYPQTNSGQSATARPLFDVLVSGAKPMLTVLLAAVLAMLLIACVNLANLLLARSSGRAQELAVRRALGAAGWRIGRQLLTESVLLGVIGGGAGALLAWAGFGAVVALLPSDQPRVHIVSLDARVLLVAAGISIVTGVIFGLLPAVHAATGRSLSLLRSGRVTGSPSTRLRTRQLLLLSEVALALILLAGAGLMVRTMANLLAIDPGFEPAGVVSAQISLPGARYAPEQRRAFFDAVIERTLAVPGVVSAAFTNSLPVQGSNWNSVFIVSDQAIPARADLPSAAFTTITAGYHTTMGIQLLRGRLLLPSDGAGSTTVAVVNETLAKRFWPNGDAIGRRIKQGWPEDQSPWREIVGIVRDVKTAGVELAVRAAGVLAVGAGPVSVGCAGRAHASLRRRTAQCHRGVDSRRRSQSSGLRHQDARRSHRPRRWTAAPDDGVPARVRLACAGHGGGGRLRSHGILGVAADSRAGCTNGARRRPVRRAPPRASPGAQRLRHRRRRRPGWRACAVVAAAVAALRRAGKGSGDARRRVVAARHRHSGCRISAGAPGDKDRPGEGDEGGLGM